MRGDLQKPMSNIINNGKELNVPLNVGNKAAKCTLSTLWIFSDILSILHSVLTIMVRLSSRRDMVRKFLFHVIACVGNASQSTEAKNRSLLEQVLNKVIGLKANTQKSLLFLSTNKQQGMENFIKLSTIAPKNRNYL